MFSVDCTVQNCRKLKSPPLSHNAPTKKENTKCVMNFTRNCRWQNLISQFDLIKKNQLASNKQKKSRRPRPKYWFFYSHNTRIFFLAVPTHTYTHTHKPAVSTCGSHIKTAANRKRGSWRALVTAGVPNTAEALCTCVPAHAIWPGHRDRAVQREPSTDTA